MWRWQVAISSTRSILMSSTSCCTRVVWQGSILCVASIIEMVDCADNAVCVAGDILHTSDEIRAVLGCKQMLDIRSISNPCNAVHVVTSSVLPLKPVPEVDCSHDICVEHVHILADAVVKELVSNGRVVENCLAATGKRSALQTGLLRTHEAL